MYCLTTSYKIYELTIVKILENDKILSKMFKVHLLEISYRKKLNIRLVL